MATPETLQRQKDILMHLISIAPESKPICDIRESLQLPETTESRVVINHALDLLLAARLVRRKRGAVIKQNRYRSHTQRVWKYYVPIGLDAGI